MLCTGLRRGKMHLSSLRAVKPPSSAVWSHTSEPTCTMSMAPTFVPAFS